MSHFLLSIVAVAFVVLWPAGAYAARGDCGQPVTDGGAPTASDCLHILKTSVGSAVCAPTCICDVNHAGGVTAPDALLCLKKAVGQQVTLDCGPECTGTTTTTLPGVRTTELIVFTKLGASYATSDLASTWDLAGLATGPDAPYWNRGSLVVQSNGNFSGTFIEMGGATDNIAGKLALAADGILTCTTSQCPLEFQGAMDAGKTVLAITYTWESGSTQLLLGTRRANAYHQADLAGTWNANNMTSQQGAPEWERGAFVIQPNGALSGELTSSDGSTETITAMLEMAGNGAITCSGYCSPDVGGAPDSGKTIAALTYSDDSLAANLMVLCRKGDSYGQSDLAGTWRAHALASGEDAPLWTRGSIVIEPDGAFSGSVTKSDGQGENVAGTFVLGSDGIVTVVDDEGFRCTMDADKTVFVCTSTW